MDLGVCPRCGVDWVKGKEVCENCGFVPIGAGLKKLNEEAEQRVEERLTFSGIDATPAREPGSPFGVWLSSLALVALGLCYQGSVWNNDWESVRVLTGEKPAIDVRGSWGIAKCQQLDARGAPMQSDGLTGTLQFGANGAFRFKFGRGFDTMEATGTYRVSGNRLIAENLKGDNGGAPLPARVVFYLVYNEGTSMVLDIEKQERLNLVKLEESR